MSKKGNGSDGDNLLFCSFCGKNQNEVRKLIAGPSVYICDECVDLCNDIIKEELNESTQSEEQEDFLRRPTQGLMAPVQFQPECNP